MFTEETVGAIVSRNHKTAAIFEKYNIDFCCGGKKILGDVLNQMNIDHETVLTELASTLVKEDKNSNEFEQLNTLSLLDHIFQKHHSFIREQGPVISAHLDKLSSVHGIRHEYLFKLRDVFNHHYGTLVQHLMKEEMMLFPYIRAMVINSKNGIGRPGAVFPSVQHPVRMMETEHEEAGAELAEIRSLTGNFVVPEDACNTWRVTWKELREWEMDIHQHIHLENNILHGRALKLETSFS